MRGKADEINTGKKKIYVCSNTLVTLSMPLDCHQRHRRLPRCQYVCARLYTQLWWCCWSRGRRHRCLTLKIETEEEEEGEARKGESINSKLEFSLRFMLLLLYLSVVCCFSLRFAIFPALLFLFVISFPWCGVREGNFSPGRANAKKRKLK